MEKKMQNNTKNKYSVEQKKEKKQYAEPSVIPLGTMQKITLGGSNITSNDSETGTPPGPYT